jgi:hypothetical protein
MQAGDSWLVFVTPSVSVLPEDIPEDIAAELSGISYLTLARCEGQAPDEVHHDFIKLIRGMVHAAEGVALDRQTGRLYTTTRIKRLESLPKNSEEFAILEFSWWFTDGPLLSPQGLSRFIEVLEVTLPEALPRRYGLSEPPQHSIAQTSKAHFLTFLQEHAADNIIWYPHRPVVGVMLIADSDWGPRPRGFRANYLSIDLEARVLKMAGWQREVRRFWRSMSRLIRPYYGDLRRLEHYRWSGPTIDFGSARDEHPVKSVWWKGIPHTMGLAAVVGPPYLELWPELMREADLDDGQAFLSLDDWAAEGDVAQKVGGVPERISPGRSAPWHLLTEYPEVWPFSGPITSSPSEKKRDPSTPDKR